MKRLARRSYPIWIYGLPRTGSSWLTSYFFGAFQQPAYKEPWEFIQCSSVSETEDKINCGSSNENPRPELMKRLGFNSLPLDRLTLAIHRRFVFKFLFDFNIVPALMKVFPKSRFVWTTRDGRDQVESFYNPDPDHWPQTKFDFLGTEKKERFVGAVLRFIDFTQGQLALLNSFKERIIRIKYEQFTRDFQTSAKKLLGFTGFSVDQPELDRIEQGFKARHGMYRDWEDWQKKIFIDTGADALNRLLGYGRGRPGSQHFWEQGF